MMENVPIVLKSLPVDVRGFVCLGSDYEPIIVINSRLALPVQIRLFRLLSRKARAISSDARY